MHTEDPREREEFSYVLLRACRGRFSHRMGLPKNITGRDTTLVASLPDFFGLNQ
jgi:hypothetical protein